MSAPTTTTVPHLNWTPQLRSSLYEFLDGWVAALESDATARPPGFPFHQTPQSRTFSWVDSPPNSQDPSESETSPPELILPVPQAFELLLEYGGRRRDTGALVWKISLGQIALAVFEIPHDIWHHLQHPFVPSAGLVLQAMRLSISHDGAPIGLKSKITSRAIPVTPSGTGTGAAQGTGYFQFQPVEEFDFVTLQNGMVVVQGVEERLLLECAEPGCTILLPWGPQTKWCAAHFRATRQR